ncbi:hypothetical protein GQ457_15G026760 [Hibiscus cannabinus]
MVRGCSDFPVILALARLGFELELESESDNATVVDILTYNSYRLSNGALVVKIRELLSRSWEVRIRSVPHEANSVADKLAAMARDAPLSTQVYANPPFDILQLVAVDIGSQWGQGTDGSEDGSVLGGMGHSPRHDSNR